MSATIGLAALVLGTPAALFVLWPLLGRRDEPVAAPADESRAALEAEKASALRAVQELAFEHQIGHMADADYVELRARYEARASAILRRLDALGPPPPVTRLGHARAAGPGVAPRVPWSRHPAVLGAAGAGLLLFGVVIGILVTRFTSPTPPEPVTTGGLPAATPEGGPSRPIPTAMLAGMLQAAHASLDAGRYPEAIAAYKAVLKREPTNVDAITHLGVILALAGHTDDALGAFDRALAIDPDYPHALWDKARVLHDQKQDDAGALEAWERFVRVGPPGPDREQALARIREVKGRLTGAPPR